MQRWVCPFLHNQPSPATHSLGSTDVPLKHQLQTHRQSLLALASTWHSHVWDFSPAADWPVVLCHGVLPLDTSADVDDPDEWIDLDDFGPLPDDILELDDQHAAFLEEDPHQAEADEVERLVTRIELVTEQRSAAF